MKWMRHNFLRSLVVLAGLLVFFSPGSSFAADLWYDCLLRAFYNGQLHWPFLDMPSPQTQLNFIYFTFAAWDDENGFHQLAVQTPQADRGTPYVDAYDIGLRELRASYPRSPTSSSGISMFSDLVIQNGSNCDETAFEDYHTPDLWISLDPWYGGWRTCWPIYNTVIGPLDPSSPNRCSVTFTNNYGNIAFLSRAYVVPQRITETNGWNDLLWDMYGDGRMYFPRFIYEGGYPAMANVTPFDEDFWTQMMFRGRGFTPTLDHTFYPNLPSMSCQWLDGSPTSSSTFHFVNKGYWVTNAHYYADQPLLTSILPNNITLNNLPSYRVLEGSFTSAKYGVVARSFSAGSSSPLINAKDAPVGYSGYLVLPRSQPNTVAQFRRFNLLPTLIGDNFAYALRIYKPGGLAWSRNGELLFDTPSAHDSISKLFEWPLTSDWTYESGRAYPTNSSIPPYDLPVEGIVIPGSVPLPDPRVVPGAPSSPSPPILVSGGGGSGGGGSGGYVSPLQPNNPVPYSGGYSSYSLPGTSIKYSDHGFLISDGASTVYIPEGSELQNPPYYPTEEPSTASLFPEVVTVRLDGDMTGYSDLDLPAVGDILDLDSLEDPYKRATLDNIADDLFLWDFMDHNLFDHSLSYATSELEVEVQSIVEDPWSSESPNSYIGFDYRDNLGSWFFDYLPFEPVLEASSILVFPAPTFENGEWNRDVVKSVDIHDSGSLRTVFLYIIFIALSLLFFVHYARLLSGGDGK